MKRPVDLNGVAVWPECLDEPAQMALVAVLRDVVARAPFYAPVTRWGKPLSVRMSSAGRFGWYSDRKGYRYVERHPVTGEAFPPIPAPVLDLWQRLAPTARQPESCLINWYREGARMGLHQDRDEADFTQPVLSVSLGDEALFRVGGTERGGSTRSLWLRSGDVAVLCGAARLAFHGIDRIRPGTSSLLRQGGRINLTLRVVT